MARKKAEEQKKRPTTIGIQPDLYEEVKRYCAGESDDDEIEIKSFTEAALKKAMELGMRREVRVKWVSRSRAA